MKMLMICALLIFPMAAQAAERILALTPHICEMMYAIGAGDEVVGAGEFCDYPEAVTTLPKVANHRQVYVEAAMRLNPTLAVALSSALPGIARLEEKGVRIVASNPQTVGSLLDDMLRLGAITGHADEAERVVTGLRQRLHALHSNKSGPKPKAYYEIWHEPLMAAGGKSLIHSVLSELGVENIFAELPMEGPRVSVESVLLARPDIIIIPDESDVQARIGFWKKWFGEYPVRFVTANTDLLHRPGPRLVQGMEALQAALTDTQHD